jgi:hypothetical protein
LPCTDRGLIGLAVHPRWPSSPYIYLGYVQDWNSADFSGRKHNILSRFTFDPSTERVDPGSEVVFIGDCRLPKVDDWYGDDCMPQDGTTHTINWLAFGRDGNLWVAVGDGETFEGETWDWNRRSWLGPMDTRFLGGKILRLNPENGLGLTDNPFWDGNPTSAASRVWAVGLRNPFRCSWIPNTDNDLMVGLLVTLIPFFH